MSGVCGYERRCLDDECLFGTCHGCPVAEALDAYGIGGRAESRQQVLDAMAAVQEVGADADATRALPR